MPQVTLVCGSVHIHSTIGVSPAVDSIMTLARIGGRWLVVVATERWVESGAWSLGTLPALRFNQSLHVTGPRYNPIGFHVSRNYFAHHRHFCHL